MNCPACKGPRLEDGGSLFDDRYGYPGAFKLLKCLQCGHRFLDAQFEERDLVRLYSDYYPRASFEISSYKPYHPVNGLQAWLDGERASPFRWVPPQVRILDIGCGFGEALGYHRNRGCEVYGVEADSNAQKVAEEYHLPIHQGLFEEGLFPDDFFDYITLSQVIEHVQKPGAMFSVLAKVLRKDGRIILSTPNANGLARRLFGRYWMNWHAPYHLHLFSRRSMDGMLAKTGLTIERALTVTPSAWFHFQRCHIATFPEMGAVSPFWLPTAPFSPWKHFLMRLSRLFFILRIDHIVTRVFDGLGIGDNFVFILRRS